MSNIITRRGLLGGILVAAVAPVFIRSERLMQIVPVSRIYKPRIVFIESMTITRGISPDEFTMQEVMWPHEIFPQWYPPSDHINPGILEST